ncbi:MAG: tyrosine recombinase [Syntrophothermus sp.]
MEAQAELFIEYLASERGLAPNTCESYTHDLKEFMAYLQTRAIRSLDGVTPALVAEYLSFLQKNGKAASTVLRRLAAIRSFFRFLGERRQIRFNPTVGIASPRAIRRTPQLLGHEEIASLLKQPDLREPIGLRDRAMLEVLYSSGLRVSELIALDTPDISLEKGVLRCRQVASKPRIIPLAPRVVECVDEYLVRGRSRLIRGTGEKALFVNHHGCRLTRQGFWKIMKAYAAAAGIKTPLTPRAFRYSFAAHLLAQGTELRKVQQILGHADISTTHNYTKLAQRRTD